jgi:hypothetical protein
MADFKSFPDQHGVEVAVNVDTITHVRIDSQNEDQTTINIVGGVKIYVSKPYQYVMDKIMGIIK